MLSVDVQDVLVGVSSTHRDVKESVAAAGKARQIIASCEAEKLSTKVRSDSNSGLLMYFPVDTD